MANTKDVERIVLPDSGWWDLNSNPDWNTIKAFRAKLTALGDIDDAGAEIIDMALVEFTDGWSFPEPVTLEAIGTRRASDLIPVMEVVSEKLVPLLQALGESFARKQRPNASSEPSEVEASPENMKTSS